MSSDSEEVWYRDHSVSYWYRRAIAYQEAVNAAWIALRKFSIEATGSKTLADAISELQTRHETSTEEVRRAYNEGWNDALKKINDYVKLCERTTRK